MPGRRGRGKGGIGGGGGGGGVTFWGMTMCNLVTPPRYPHHGAGLKLGFMCPIGIIQYLVGQGLKTDVKEPGHGITKRYFS